MIHIYGFRKEIDEEEKEEWETEHITENENTADASMFDDLELTEAAADRSSYSERVFESKPSI